MASHVHIVVFENHDFPRQIRVLRKAVNGLDILLARVVGGVRLAGKHKLHWAFRIIYDALEALEVRKQQGSPLVGGKAAGKTDGQSVRVQHRFGALNQLGAGLVAGVLNLEAFAHKFNHLDLERVHRSGQICVWDFVQSLPHFPVLEPLGPVCGEHARVQIAQFLSNEGEAVRPVGDVSNRHFLRVCARVEKVPHPPRDMTVQLTDPVGLARGFERQHGHAEGGSPGLVVQGQIHKLFSRDGKALKPLVQIVVHYFLRKGVVSSGNRGVGGKGAAGPHHLERFPESERTL